jgi:hypothetical protein
MSNLQKKILAALQEEYPIQPYTAFSLVDLRNIKVGDIIYSFSQEKLRVEELDLDAGRIKVSIGYKLWLRRYKWIKTEKALYPTLKDATASYYNAYVEWLAARLCTPIRCTHDQELKIIQSRLEK